VSPREGASDKMQSLTSSCCQCGILRRAHLGVYL
jgi:hypothetical protein